MPLSLPNIGVTNVGQTVGKFFPNWVVTVLGQDVKDVGPTSGLGPGIHNSAQTINHFFWHKLRSLLVLQFDLLLDLPTTTL